MDHPTAPLPPSPMSGATQPHPRRGRRLGELTAVGLLSAALATGGTWGALSLADSPQAAPATASASGAGTASVLPVSSGAKSNPDWNAVTAAVSPSVVAIGVKSAAGGGEGSGVILDSAGHVLTNHHVVSGAGEGAKISITLKDGTSYAATVAGEDASTDLAVVTIKDPPKDLKPITVGSSAQVQVGDPVMAVGNPLGLSGTVTTGIVSALNRPVTTSSAQAEPNPFDPGSQQGSGPVVTSAIQTSAAINPGNSGGALVDAAGRLVGINSSIATLGGSGGGSGNIGIGFAIPIDEANWIADQLIADGTAQHAFLGVTPTDGRSSQGSVTRSGAQLRSVSHGSPAADAGLKSGDLVLAVDDTPVTSAESLIGLVHAHKIGSSVTLTVLRDGQQQKVKATLGPAPTDPA